MRQEIIPLQFLRGLAASLVLLSHFLDRLVRRGVVADNAQDWILPMGHLGVMMFFAISGFIMIYTTQKEFAERTGARRFLVRRIIRIAPLYYVTTLAMIGFRYVTAPFSTDSDYVAPGLMDLIKSIFFIPYLNEQSIIQPIYAVGWSLNFEMMFYLLFAAGMTLGKRVGIPAILLTLCTLALIGLALPFPHRDSAQIVSILYFYTRSDLVFFVIGMGVALLFRKSGPISTSLNDAALCLLAALALCSAILAPGMWALAAVTLALCIATLFWKNSAPVGLFPRFARLFGDISYSVYLTHSFLLGILALVVARYVPMNIVTLPLTLIFSLLLCTIAGWLCWRFVEQPMTQYLRDKNRHQDPPLSPPPTDRQSPPPSIAILDNDATLSQA